MTRQSEAGSASAMTLPDDEARVAIESDLVERIIHPLLDNALRYGRSEVSIRARPGWAERNHHRFRRRCRHRDRRDRPNLRARHPRQRRRDRPARRGPRARACPTARPQRRRRNRRPRRPEPAAGSRCVYRPLDRRAAILATRAQRTLDWEAGITGPGYRADPRR